MNDTLVKCCISNAWGVLPDIDAHPHGSLTSYSNEGKEFKECYTARKYVL